MPDGNRRRRHSANQAKRRWYAEHRARRFRRRFWSGNSRTQQPQTQPSEQVIWSFSTTWGAMIGSSS
jgi:hypothetical protein